MTERGAAIGRWVRWMDRRFYPDSGANWDDARFREEILRYLRPDWTILDLGAGAGIVRQMDFRGVVGQVCGIDPDERVTSNPFLDEGLVAPGESIPYGDGEFDLVFADNVLEHLEDPEAVFREVARVVRPGGYFLAKTPNRRHYVPSIARATPHGFHEWVARRRGRREMDTFPTRYRVNTPGDVRRIASAAGLSTEAILLIEGRPEYLRIHPLTYVVGMLMERAMNSTESLASFRAVLIAILRRPR